MATYNEERKWTVYMHINKINGKKYIGITSTKPEKRWKNGHGYKKQMFYNAIKKYGWDNFEHKILYTELTECDAKSKEIELIDKYNTVFKEFGYNNDIGGGIGKIGVKNTESVPVVIDNIKFESINACAKYLNIGRDNISNWLKGKTSMPKTYFDRGLSYYNKDLNNINVNINKETIKHNNKSSGFIKVMIDGIVFNTIKECSIYLNVSRKNITNWLNGKTPMPKKYFDRNLIYVDLDNSKIRCSKRNDSGFKKVIIDDIIFNTIKDVSDYIKIDRTLVEEYLKGKVTMPKDLYNRGLRYVDESLNSNIRVRK